MISDIKGVADHLNCDIISADKVNRVLMKATEVYMGLEGTVDFKMCGVMHSLTKLDDEWIITRSVTARSTNLSDLI